MDLVVNFNFSNVIAGGVSTWKILTFPNFGVFTLIVTFEEQFLLIRTRYSPEILKIIISYLLEELGKFLSNSEMSHVQVSKIVPFGVE